MSTNIKLLLGLFLTNFNILFLNVTIQDYHLVVNTFIFIYFMIDSLATFEALYNLFNLLFFYALARGGWIGLLDAWRNGKWTMTVTIFCLIIFFRIAYQVVPKLNLPILTQISDWLENLPQINQQISEYLIKKTPSGLGLFLGVVGLLLIGLATVFIH